MAHRGRPLPSSLGAAAAAAEVLEIDPQREAISGVSLGSCSKCAYLLITAEVDRGAVLAGSAGKPQPSSTAVPALLQPMQHLGGGGAAVGGGGQALFNQVRHIL